MTKIKEQQGWQRVGTHLYSRKTVKMDKEIPRAIYSIGFNDQSRELFLKHVKPSFNFNYKIYDLDNKFVDRVVKTFKNIKNNLGILLTGIKGTGKTVMAENICNELQLPVILVDYYWPMLPDFLSSFQQNVIILFDEYEKMVSEHEDFSILGLMDGVLNSEYKKVFLLTSNTLHVNENLLARPSRIRYLKTFSNLELPVIMELINDLLVEKQHKDNLILYISGLELITVDIVKSIIEECNIHNSPSEDFQDFFNVKKANDKLFNFYKFENGKPVLWAENAEIFGANLLTRNPSKIINRSFDMRNNEVEDTFVIVNSFNNNIFEIHSQYSDKKDKFKIQVEEATYTHNSFKHYTF